MSLIAVEFPQWQILLGAAIFGFFTGFGSEASKVVFRFINEHIVHKGIINPTGRGLDLITDKFFTKKPNGIPEAPETIPESKEPPSSKEQTK